MEGVLWVGLYLFGVAACVWVASYKNWTSEGDELVVVVLAALVWPFLAAFALMALPFWLLHKSGQKARQRKERIAGRKKYERERENVR